jgi:MSHA pilin protein MshC
MLLRKWRSSYGFTLVELVIVVVVASILSAAVIVSFSAKGQYAVNTQADQLSRDIRHIQLLALAWGVSLRLSTNASGTTYTVTCRSTAVGTPCTTVGAMPVDPATGSSFAVTFTDSVTISTPLNNDLDFDSLGRPISVTTVIVTNPVRTYTLTGNGRSVSLNLLPITGFVQSS